jgi:hypothetical protein
MDACCQIMEKDFSLQCRKLLFEEIVELAPVQPIFHYYRFQITKAVAVKAELAHLCPLAIDSR